MTIVVVMKNRILLEIGVEPAVVPSSHHWATDFDGLSFVFIF